MGKNNLHCQQVKNTISFKGYQNGKEFKMFLQLSCKCKGSFTYSKVKYPIFSTLVKVKLFFIFASMTTKKIVKQLNIILAWKHFQAERTL